MSAARKKNEVDTSTYRGRFAVRLTELRTKAKLSVDELAEKSGISCKSIYAWESARFSPSIDKFPELAKALGLKSVKSLMPDV